MRGLIFGGREGPFHSANLSISHLDISNLTISNLNISDLDIICIVIAKSRYKSAKRVYFTISLTTFYYWNLRKESQKKCLLLRNSHNFTRFLWPNLSSDFFISIKKFHWLTQTVGTLLIRCCKMLQSAVIITCLVSFSTIDFMHYYVESMFASFDPLQASPSL